MLKLFAGLALACVATPAFAQECVKTDKMLAHYKSEGDRVLADVKVRGTLVDRLIIDVDKSVIWVLGSKGGCLLGPAMALSPVTGGPLDLPADQAPGPAESSPAHVDPPKPQGGGAEIGI